MKKGSPKTKTKNWLIAIIVLTILIVVNIIWLLVDFAKPIKCNEVSNSGLLAFLKSSGEENPATGNVIVNYLDTDGKKIAKSDSFTGNIGEEYFVKRPEIDGYLTYGAEPVNKTGNFTQNDIEVNLIYQSENANVEIDEENNIITVKMKNAKQPKEYNLKIITKDEKGNLIKGVDYLAKKSTGAVLRKGTVEGENFVVGTLTINEEGLDSYIVTEDSGTYYQRVFDGDIEFEINKIWDEAKNEFKIELNYDKSVKGFEIKIVDNEIIIEVENKLLVNNDKPKEDIPPIEKFDLEIIKYINKVKIENDKGSTEIERDIDKKDSILKLELDAKDISNTRLEIMYKILIKNVGDVPGYADKIVDYIPEDLEIIEDGIWIKENNKLINTSLSQILLLPGEEKELTITFKWNLNEDKLGARVNKAQILEYKNDKDLRDLTPDNIGDAEIVVAIKTGKEQICILAVLTTLLIISTVVYSEKRRIEKNKGKEVK